MENGTWMNCRDFSLRYCIQDSFSSMGLIDGFKKMGRKQTNNLKKDTYSNRPIIDFEHCIFLVRSMVLLQISQRVHLNSIIIYYNELIKRKFEVPMGQKRWLDESNISMEQSNKQ